MQYDILITKQPNNGYFARPLLMPEIVVEAANESEAIDRVREAIAATYAQSYITRIEVPLPNSQEVDPWFRFAGMWGDDSQRAQFQSDIEAFRRSIDESTSD